ncbi:MAG: sulfite exporter TauE/SafE family protein [Candidatus Paceibacterota bacterium]
MKEVVYYVKGMHCASCEIFIEKKILEMEGVKLTDASVSNGKVLIEYDSAPPAVEKLNKIFKENGYVFSSYPFQKEHLSKNSIASIIIISAVVVAGIILIGKTGISSLVNINAKSSLFAFFLFGLAAGFSTCAALVGGVILSMAKQWSGPRPHLLFSFGRIISYSFFGALLGVAGGKLQFSLKSASFLVIIVSALMILMSLQMLGIKFFQKFQIRMPKFLTRQVAGGHLPPGHGAPFLMGAFTFFLPCGFTLTAQGVAILSGSALQGGLIMGLFSLGTLPSLLAIGFSSVKFSSIPRWSERFMKIAGILVLFFALYNINAQLNVLGVKNLNENLASIIDGKQIIKMEASSSGYKPNYFKVKAGIPVRWEITDTGTSGCTNAVIARNLFDGEIKLSPGEISMREFTPQKPGRYKFSCWMGMVSGIIEVVD